MKKILLVVIAASTMFVACKKETGTSSKTLSTANFKNSKVNPDSESEKFSYSIGMIIGNTLKNNGVDSINYAIVDKAFNDNQNDQFAYTLVSKEAQTLSAEEIDLEKVDRKIVKRAILDVLEGDSTQMNIEEVSNSYRSYLQNNISKVSENNEAKGKAFLEKNKTASGVTETASGLQHKLISKGTGAKPTKNDVVEVQFTIKTIDGEKVMSTKDGAGPEYLDLSDEKSGLLGIIEGAKLYPTGSEYQLFVPSKLAFGPNRVAKDVGPNSTVVIEIHDIQTLDAKAKKEYKKAKADYQKQVEAAMKAQGRR